MTRFKVMIKAPQDVDVSTRRHSRFGNFPRDKAGIGNKNLKKYRERAGTGKFGNHGHLGVKLS